MKINNWMDMFYIWMFNFWNSKSAICHKCGTYTKLAVGWDYEKCHKCHNYLYDNRGLF